MFSCWVVKINPAAVKYVKKYNVSERELYGLQYIGGYVILQLYKKIIPRPKSTTIQFILSKKLEKYS